MTPSGVVTEADFIGEVSSKELSKSQAAQDAEIDDLLIDATNKADDNNLPPAYFCENRANKATNDRLGTYINNISYIHSSHIII